MRKGGGVRWGIATLLIALPAAGLAVVLILAGLVAAAEVAALVAALTPLVAAAVRWARPGGRMGRPIADDYQAVVGNGHEEPEPSAGTAGHPPRSHATEDFPPLPRVTFRTPAPWRSWVLFWLVETPTVAGIILIVVAILDWTRYSNGLIFAGIILAGVGLFGSLAFTSGDLNEIFDYRPRLVIDRTGIHYHWSLRRRFDCPWEKIIRVKTKGTSPYPRLVVVISSRRRDDHLPGGQREVELCPIDGHTFRKAEIRAAIASFEPSVLDAGF